MLTDLIGTTVKCTSSDNTICTGIVRAAWLATTLGNRLLLLVQRDDGTLTTLDANLCRVIGMVV